MRFLRRAMPEAEFWQLVEAMGGQADDDAVARLSEALEPLRRRRVVAFQERLARVLHELDRPELAQQPVRFVDDPDDEDPIPLSDDGFLYLRAGVVARGRETYERVLADPAELATGRWEECEELLYVAEELTGDEIETAVSYETGSNAAHWGERPDADEVDDDDRAWPPVSVEVRDVDHPEEGTTYHADGTQTSSVAYLEPDWLDVASLLKAADALSLLVSATGGLPDDLACDRVRVLVDLGEHEWELDPAVLPVPEHEVLEHVRERVVVLRARASEVEALHRRGRRELVQGLGALAVLSVLPADHDGREALEGVRDAGLAHVGR